MKVAMIEPCKVVKESRVTEKASLLTSKDTCYTFEIVREANRSEVKMAVENAFKVKVKKVRILNRKAKVRRSRTRRTRPGYVGGMKKAMVVLAKGYKIDMM
ncbi:MAG: 50S ribosomal protein L23 [Puniceicoccales bacterium]|jgi:large subunit ribosomal protein L23|nr:50S ribosomal protein L23 [Puniceicoccales bacterium]